MKTVSFKNPVCAGADPWMFAYDGWYYLCCTHGQKIILYRSKNPATIKEDEQITAFLPPEDQPFSKSLWSPEIHYFSPEDFGEEHAICSSHVPTGKTSITACMCSARRIAVPRSPLTATP